MDKVNEERYEFVTLKKNLSIEKEPIKLHKNSSSVMNNSLLSTKDVNTIKSQKYKSLEKDNNNSLKKGNKISRFEYKK